MSATSFIDDVRIMPTGQIMLPLDVQNALGVESGDSVTFIVDGNNVSIVNSAVFALMRFQEQMKGEAEKNGLFSENDIDEWITQSRREEKF